MKLVQRFINIFDRTLNLMSLLAIVLLLFIMFSVDTEVVTRYFLGFSIKGTTEFMGYSLLFITFLGAAWTLREEGHVRMDILLTRLSRGTQYLLNIFTSVLSAGVCFVLVWYGVRTTLEAYQLGLLASSELQTPQYLVLLIIPTGSFFLFIQFLRRLYGYIRSWRVQSVQGKE